jgi:hypothetical protein
MNGQLLRWKKTSFERDQINEIWKNNIELEKCISGIHQYVDEGFNLKKLYASG